MSAQLFKKLQAPPDEPKFNSLTPEKLAELEAAFHQQENTKAFRNAGVVVSSGVVLGFAVLGADGAYAAPGSGAASNAAANAKATIEAGVKNATDMIAAIDGIGLTAFGVALAPLGFMTTLRVLNMVLSRV